jgi:hypothetical protein
MTRVGFTPSTLPAGSYVIATCKTCGAHRYPSRALMIEKAGDVSLERIESRLRCLRRREPRGPACGGRMTVELASVGHRDTEAKGGWPTLPGLPPI